eukprot:6207290-Pleurochrysis_carterae.AAC.2
MVRAFSIVCACSGRSRRQAQSSNECMAACCIFVFEAESALPGEMHARESIHTGVCYTRAAATARSVDLPTATTAPKGGCSALVQAQRTSPQTCVVIAFIAHCCGSIFYLAHRSVSALDLVAVLLVLSHCAKTCICAASFRRWYT